MSAVPTITVMQCDTSAFRCKLVCKWYASAMKRCKLQVCFGRGRYEAYLKGQLRCGFKMPDNGNIIISTGLPYRSKSFRPLWRLWKRWDSCCTVALAHGQLEERHCCEVSWLLTVGGYRPKNVGTAVYNYADVITVYFSVAINMPFFRDGTRAAQSFVSQIYQTRRITVEYSSSPKTDHKCTKRPTEALYQMNSRPSSCRIIYTKCTIKIETLSIKRQCRIPVRAKSQGHE